MSAGFHNFLTCRKCNGTYHVPQKYPSEQAEQFKQMLCPSCWIGIKEEYNRTFSKRSSAVFLVLASCFLVTSCQLAQHESHAGAGKWEKDTLISIGGTTHTTGADGFDNATDHNASFQVANQTVAGGITAVQASKATINAANNVTTQQANQQASTLALQNSQQAAAAASAAAAAKVAQQNTARAAGVPALVKP